jgi:PKD repeat protein
LDGEQFFVDSFFDVFFDITVTDVDARPGRDYAGQPDGEDAPGDLTYEWDLDDNGSFETAGSTPTFSAAGLDGPSMVTVTLRVTDTGGLSDTDTATVQIANVAPTVNAPTVSPEPSDEGESVTASATFSDPADALDAPYTCTVDYGEGDGPEAGTVAGNTCTGPSHAYEDDGTYTVTVEVTDDDGASGDADTDHAVENVPPTVDTPTVSPEPSDEGEEVTASATFSDPAGDADAPYTCTVDYGDGGGPEAGTVAGDTCTGPAHTYADDGPYTVTVAVTDKDGGTGEASTSHGVDNVAPEIGEASSSAEECGDTPEGGVVEVEAEFSDPGFDNAVAGTLEDFDASTIDWGDGTVEAATVSETPGGPGVPTTGSVSGSHVYAGGGVFTITITVEDDDGGTDSVELMAIVTGAGLNGGELQVVGTNDKDVIQIQEKKGGVEVHSKLLDPRKQSFPAEDVDSIRVLACDGDDQVHLNRDLEVPAIVDGGAGNDHLMAGSGPAWLMGGADDDHLFGGPDGDLLEGGEGNDHLFGRGGDDLLDGGPGIDDCNPGQEVGDAVVACEM